jgi:hypothetical protein
MTQKRLTIKELKASVFESFCAETTAELQRKLPTKLNLTQRTAWETLYRKYVGILPGEEYEVGATCINGMDIFKYFHPWRVFNLGQEPTEADLYAKYSDLMDCYPTDVENVEDLAFNGKMRERLTLMYWSTQGACLNREDMPNILQHVINEANSEYTRLIRWHGRALEGCISSSSRARRSRYGSLLEKLLDPLPRLEARGIQDSDIS